MTKNDIEIDWIKLASKLWTKRVFILRVTLIGFIAGVIIAFSIPKEYKTSIILTLESGSSQNGSMGTLTSMVGINLGSGVRDEVFSPELYPTVLNSTPFVQGLLEVNVVDVKQDIDTTLYSYLKDNQKRTWWSYIFGAPKALFALLSSKESSISTSQYFISEEEMTIIKQLRDSYSIDADKKTGVITLEVVTQSPKIAAFLGDTLTNYLQQYIIEHRTKKAKTDLANSEKLYEQAKVNYYKSQQSLATFMDENKNITSARYRINQEKLQNEADIARSVYTQMAQQVQMSKIKVQDDTPVFTIIQPAVEPLIPFSPNKKVILVAFLLLSIVGISVWIVRKDLLYLLID